ncbi:uncharacterized protein LOC120006252 isoform X1 [Tripterygium wilfordii]|uniref:uncharacterized protein LOC120006252 isoform X1 n=2 Tax=Tripterygium wilfordii TaxID=458696 RepID=UPI0018F858E0|nr:uncharacterized protein LOC120006252 isoform X1 [Tripterygium wilfordii]
MSSVNTFPSFPSSSSRCIFAKLWPIRSSFSTRRRSRRRLHLHLRRHRQTPNKLAELSKHDDGDSNNNLKLVLDIDRISALSSREYQQYLSSARDACQDLLSLVTIDSANRRVVVSCRRSTLLFAGHMLVIGFALLLGIRVLSKLVLGFKGRFVFGSRRDDVVVRRDRSLGGKEVVVAARSIRETREDGMMDNFGALKKNIQVRSQEKLPKWWPVRVVIPAMVADKEEYQREANKLIRAIMDCRTSGKDIMEDDIIQLRRICRISGVRVSIDTTNSCYTLYRTSVNFVLNVCSRASSYRNSVVIDGEDVRQFIAGLAENIGLENTRAARMVSASVAARTRSCFLQAWALELQGRHSEAMAEVSKICIILRTFPPEESSPEMELVARGLEKQLKVEQREFLMNMIVGVCGEESHRSAAEALGLMLSARDIGKQWKSNAHEN